MQTGTTASPSSGGAAPDAVSLVLDVGNHLGETPIWSAAEQALWWVNCEGPPELLRWSPATGALARFAMPQRVGGFVPKASGGLLVVLADGLYDFEPATGDLAHRVASPTPPTVRLHECHCDRQGRFWVGAYDGGFPADRTAAGGAFHRLDGDTLTPLIPGISVANGLAFAPDGRTMYAADSPSKRVMAYDLDPATGAISGARVFLTLEPGCAGHIDGATVDDRGGYWVAMVGVGELRRYDPAGGLARTVRLPFSNPTKPAFGGPDLETLYVTSTTLAINPQAAGFDRNGGLFALRPGERGVAEVPFAG